MKALAILGWLLFCLMVAFAIDRDAQPQALIEAVDEPDQIAHAVCAPQSPPPPRIYHPWQVAPPGAPDHRRLA